MKTILLWDRRFPERRPRRLILADAIASAAVRAGVAAPANPGDYPTLAAGGALSADNPVEIMLQHGPMAASLARVMVPMAVALVAIAAGTAASIGPAPVVAPVTVPIAAKITLNGLASTASLAGAVPAGVVDVANADNPMGQASVLQFTPQAANTHYFLVIPLAGPTDLRGGTIELTMKLAANIANLNACDIELHSSATIGTPTADYSGLLGWNEAATLLKTTSTAPDNGIGTGRWQTFGFHSQAAPVTIAGAGADMSAIRWIRIRFRSSQAAANAPVFQLGPIRFQPNPLPKAQLILAFDDGFDTAFAAHQAARAKGFPVVIQPGAIQAVLGQPGRLTLAQMQQMQAEGSQMAAQAWDTEATHSQAQEDAIQAFYTANGLTGAGFGSYHSQISQRTPEAWPIFAGAYPQGVRTYMTARGANPPMTIAESYPWPDRRLVRALAGDSAGVSGFRIAHLEQAIASKGVAIMVWHQDTTGLAEVIDYADTHRDVLEVTTPARLAATFIQ
jgi:hypothetical protein